MKKYIKDIIVILLLLLTALGTYLLLYLTNNQKAGYVQVYKEDMLIQTYALNKDGSYPITIENHFNEIIINKGMVSMKEANCPDKLCVKQGKISKSGESIICLPHKVVVKISAKEEEHNE